MAAKTLRDDQGLYLIVSIDAREATCAALVEAGIPFRDATDDGNTCSGPVYAWLRFPARVAAQDVECALRELP